MRRFLEAYGLHWCGSRRLCHCLAGRVQAAFGDSKAGARYLVKLVCESSEPDVTVVLTAKKTDVVKSTETRLLAAKCQPRCRMYCMKAVCTDFVALTGGSASTEFP